MKKFSAIMNLLRKEFFSSSTGQFDFSSTVNFALMRNGNFRTNEESGRKRLFEVGSIIMIALSLCSFTKIPTDEGEKTVTFQVQTNGQNSTLNQVVDKQNIPQYYYADFTELPYNTEDTKETVNIRLYWDVFGNYLTFELPQKEDLTKLNNKPFSDKEYKKLYKTLNDSHSSFKFHNYEKLSAKQCENQYHVDAISGASNLEQDVEMDYINGAIKKSYALWRTVYGEISTEIKALKKDYYNQHQVTSDFNTTTYETANTEEKLVLLNNLLLSDKALNNIETDMLLEDLSTNNRGLFTAIVTILEKDENNHEALNKVMSSFLSDTGFKQIMAYKVLLQNGENRNLKQVTLPLRSIKL